MVEEESGHTARKGPPVRVIIGGRGSGRTEQLIHLCAEAESQGEISYIICLDQPEARRIFQRADEMGVSIGFPITLREFLTHQYFSRNIKNFYIDNLDHLLRSLTDVNIQAITLEDTMEGKGVLQGDQYPKGVSEERIREIAREEVVNGLAALREAVADGPAQDDGNLNGRDFVETLRIAGESLTPHNPAEARTDV